jgi:HK97 family phage portal protein
MNHFPTFTKAAEAVREKLRDVLEFVALRPGGRARAPRAGNGRLPGSSRNWENEAGNVWDNSAVSLLLRWFCNTFCEAPLTVQQANADGNDETVLMHELTVRVKQPNRHFTRSQLFKATLLSYFCDGNAYWWKRRSQAGKPVELWWIPHWLLEPKSSDDEAEWLEGGDAFISYYEYSVNNKTYRYAPADIIHFKEGVDPANYRKGLSPLKALFREICTDNQILTYTYGILKNAGVPSYTMSPDFSKGEVDIDEDFATATKRKWRAATSEDNAGDVMILTTPWKLEKLGYSPNDLAIDGIGALGEARIAAAFSIPAVTVGLLVGLREANAKASHAEAKLQAYESGIMPVQRDFCETLDRHLLPELGDEMREYCEFNTSEVAALKENQNEIAKRADDGFRNNVVKLNEARTARGLPIDDALDGYSWEIVPQSTLGMQLDSHLSDSGNSSTNTGNQPDDANKAARRAITKFWQLAKRPSAKRPATQRTQ